MSKKEGDYSDYLQHNSGLMQMYAVFSGFVFTVITLLLTLLPDPSQIMAQITLFFLAFLWSLFILIIFVRMSNASYFIRTIPPIPKRPYKIMNWIEYLAWFSLTVPVVLMFFLWNLTYLALASVGMFVLFYIFVLVVFVRPIFRSMAPGRRNETSSN